MSDTDVLVVGDPFTLEIECLDDDGEPIEAHDVIWRVRVGEGARQELTYRTARSRRLTRPSKGVYRFRGVVELGTTRWSVRAVDATGTTLAYRKDTFTGEADET